MPAPATFRARHGLIVALDAETVDACKRTVDLTSGVAGVVGYKLGMTTVLVSHPGNEDAEIINRRDGAQDHVHHRTDDLAGFLRSVMSARAGAFPRTA